MHLYIGLVHYPVYNKNHERIASAITTLDLHDISRLARTYEAKRFFVITPLEDQQRLADSIYRHWTIGYGAHYNEHRKEAIELLCIVPSLQRCVEVVQESEGQAPIVVATDASRQGKRVLSYERARAILTEEGVVILIFGTAWGLDEEVLDEADYVLKPIRGRSEYNHLSVRSAAAIILDRLAGRYE